MSGPPLCAQACQLKNGATAVQYTAAPSALVLRKCSSQHLALRSNANRVPVRRAPSRVLLQRHGRALTGPDPVLYISFVPEADRQSRSRSRLYSAPCMGGEGTA